jgi:peroxiredoxin Q/BCP
MPIGPGDPAPDFSLPADGKSTITLSALRGQPTILYFYPKDDTSGCTREALDFNATLPAFRKAGAMVIGVSKDSPERHDRFKAKHGLAFPLASDADGKVCVAYGVWKKKSLYGRTFMGIERSTFLIDANGVIRQVWRKVKVAGHAAEVLVALTAL